VSDYEAFVASKLALPPPTGLVVDEDDLPASLFEFQKALTAWALRRGRAAIFAATGLGKSAMSLSWAKVVASASEGDVLVLAPLAVARQTAREGARIGIDVTVCREANDARPGINVTNYDRLHRFDPKAFTGVVIDEGSCIKHFDSATFKALLEGFSETPWRLSCTATPAPNDWVELGTQAEFLGVCKRTEMLSEFFVHDGGDTQTWRLKGHAKGAFWRWVASWAALVQHPRDLGPEFDHPGYDLPPLRLHEHLLPVDADQAKKAGLLFVEEAAGLMAQREARRVSIDARVAACAELVNADRERWGVWCDLNAESLALAKAIPDAVEVTGSMDVDSKEAALEAFIDGKHRVLDSKGSICGFGVNLQFCHKVAFVGVSHSWETWFQTIRRFWRFGQTEPVDVHIFASEAEGAVVANLKRKDEAAREMALALAAETREAVRSEVLGATRTVDAYDPKTPMTVPDWVRSEA
jgi:superfamily II DNA or RNA helicase